MRWADSLLASGLPITWGTLSVGLSGNGLPRGLLTPSDALRLSENVISSQPSIDDEMAHVLGLSVADEEELQITLDRIAAGQEADLSREIRKWRLLLLEKQMEDLPDDPLYGLLRLREFWSQFEYPGDSPHTVQGVADGRDPVAYYTRSNLDAELSRHRPWLESERAALMD